MMRENPILVGWLIALAVLTACGLCEAPRPTGTPVPFGPNPADHEARIARECRGRVSVRHFCRERIERSARKIDSSVR